MDKVIAAISTIQRRWQLYYSSLTEPDGNLKEYYQRVGLCLDTLRAPLMRGDAEEFDRIADRGMAGLESDLWVETLDVLFQELGISMREELSALLSQ